MADWKEEVDGCPFCGKAPQRYRETNEHSYEYFCPAGHTAHMTFREWNRRAALNPKNDTDLGIALRDLLVGREVYVMHPEHIADQKRPLNQITYGAVMDSRVVFTSKLPAGPRLEVADENGLLPCPLCKGPAKMDTMEYGITTIACAGRCNLIMSHRHPVEARDAWNTRT